VTSLRNFVYSRGPHVEGACSRRVRYMAGESRFFLRELDAEGTREEVRRRLGGTGRGVCESSFLEEGFRPI